MKWQHARSVRRSTLPRIVVLDSEPLPTGAVGLGKKLLNELMVIAISGNDEIRAIEPALTLLSGPDENERCEFERDLAVRLLLEIQAGIIPTGSRVSIDTYCQRPSTV